MAFQWVRAQQTVPYLCVPRYSGAALLQVRLIAHPWWDGLTFALRIADACRVPGGHLPTALRPFAVGRVGGLAVPLVFHAGLAVKGGASATLAAGGRR